MIDQLTQWDIALFKAIHVAGANAFFDAVLPILREARVWLPLYLVFIVIAIRFYKTKGAILVGFVLAAVGIADRFSAGFMKPFFARLRPCHNPELQEVIRELIHCGGQYGFISSHATNHFALAVLFTWFFQQHFKQSVFRWVFYLWAALICYAQVYVAKHYPADVLVGAVCGMLIGQGVLLLYQKTILKSNYLKTQQPI
jgi:membrane-associated phospholipid phosphatase